MTKKSSRKHTRKSPRNSGLKVKYAEANRVRLLLLSENVQTLEKRDIQTLLNILDDVYPARIRTRKSRQVWQPLLIGIGIGLILVIVLAVML